MNKPLPRVGWVQVAGSHSGGHWYGEAVRRAVQDRFDIRLEDVRARGMLRPLVMQARLAALRSRGGYDLLVLDNAATLVMPLPCAPKHLVVVYHIGLDSISSPWERALLGAVEPLCLRHLRAADHVVTICQFWQERLQQLGVPRVTTIHNGFDESDFQVSDAEVAALRAKYALTKPIVYIGNCQATKGVRESYAALKDLDVHLVTSGRRMVHLPARNLELGYREYLTLLAASSVVVTMSKFDEGWCRTAHEAMLLRRPVVGSGRGGMGELLQGGGQVISPRFEDLRGHVQRLLSDQPRAQAMGEAGFTFARTFTAERFRRAWVELLGQLSATTLSPGTAAK